MTKQNADDKKAKIRKQGAARQRRLRARRANEGYPKREYYLNDKEDETVVALIDKMRAASNEE